MKKLLILLTFSFLIVSCVPAQTTSKDVAGTTMAKMDTTKTPIAKCISNAKVSQDSIIALKAKDVILGFIPSTSGIWKWLTTTLYICGVISTILYFIPDKICPTQGFWHALIQIWKGLFPPTKV